VDVATLARSLEPAVRMALARYLGTHVRTPVALRRSCRDRLTRTGPAHPVPHGGGRVVSGGPPDPSSVPSWSPHAGESPVTGAAPDSPAPTPAVAFAPRSSRHPSARPDPPRHGAPSYAASAPSSPTAPRVASASDPPPEQRDRLPRKLGGYGGLVLTITAPPSGCPRKHHGVNGTGSTPVAGRSGRALRDGDPRRRRVDPQAGFVNAKALLYREAREGRWGCLTVNSRSRFSSRCFGVNAGHRAEQLRGTSPECMRARSCRAEGVDSVADLWGWGSSETRLKSGG